MEHPRDEHGEVIGRRRCAAASPTELGHLIHTTTNDEFLAIAIDEAARRTPIAQQRAADAAGEVR